MSYRRAPYCFDRLCGGLDCSTCYGPGWVSDGTSVRCPVCEGAGSIPHVEGPECGDPELCHFCAGECEVDDFEADEWRDARVSLAVAIDEAVEDFLKQDLPF